MWTSLIENYKSIAAIYSNDVPSLKGIVFQDINFINGLDLTCNFRFDVKELPSKLPPKWVGKDVNTVQIQLHFIKTEITCFEYSGSRIPGDINITLENEHKRVEFTISNNIVFVLKVKWIYVNGIVGYNRA